MVRTGTKDTARARELAGTLCVELSRGYEHITLGLECIITKLLILSKKKYAHMDDHRNITTKGLEMVRRDWCNLSRCTSRFVLDRRFLESGPERAIPLIIDELRRIALMIVRNNGEPVGLAPEGGQAEITVADLVVFRAITKPLDEYTRQAVHVSVGRWMVRNGFVVNARDTIPFVMVNSKSKDFDQKARHPSQVERVADVDMDWYIESQIIPPIVKLCQQFLGPKEEEIQAALRITGGPTCASTVEDEKLYFACPGCRTAFLVCKTATLTCRKCKMVMNWRNVANQILVRFRALLSKWTRDNDLVCTVCGFRTDQFRMSESVHRFGKGEICKRHLRIETQSADIYKSMRSLSIRVDEMRKKAPAAFGQFMGDYMTDMLSMHELNSIRFTTLLSVSSQE